MWVKAAHYFETPGVVLVLTQRDALRCSHVRGILLRDQSGPEKIEAALVELIGNERPDIAGGFLSSISYNVAMQRWEMTYHHRALPKKKLFEMLDVMDLVPRTEPEGAPNCRCAVAAVPQEACGDTKKTVSQHLVEFVEKFGLPPLTKAQLSYSELKQLTELESDECVEVVREQR